MLTRNSWVRGEGLAGLGRLTEAIATIDGALAAPTVAASVVRRGAGGGGGGGGGDLRNKASLLTPRRRLCPSRRPGRTLLLRSAREPAEQDGLVVREMRFCPQLCPLEESGRIGGARRNNSSRRCTTGSVDSVQAPAVVPATAGVTEVANLPPGTKDDACRALSSQEYSRSPNPTPQNQSAGQPRPAARTCRPRACRVPG